MLAFTDYLTQKAMKNFFSTKWRPHYHFSAPRGFMNDPHPPVFFQGQYHVFFQYYPLEAQGVRPKCWGHVVTRDFYSWEILPTAIAPDTPADRDGCASGTVVVEGEKLWLIYTGRNYYRQPRETICAAVSEDGIHFKKSTQNPIIQPQACDSLMDFRDPAIYTGPDGNLYLLVGTQQEGKPVLRRYTAGKSMLYWHSPINFLTSPPNMGVMWECPCLTQENGIPVLLLSPEHIDGVRQKSVYVSGNFLLPDGSLSFDTRQDADRGGDYYAAQFFRNEKKELMSLAWMSKWDNQLPTQQEGWTGIFTAPRKLYRDTNGKIRGKFMAPEGLRVVSSEKRETRPENPLSFIQSNCYYLELELLKQEAPSVLSFFCGKEPGLTLTIDWYAGMVHVQNHTVSHRGHKHSFALPDAHTGKLHLQVLADICCLELCLNQLEFVTHCVYAEGTGVVTHISPEKLQVLDYYEVGQAPIYMQIQN